MDNCAVEDSRRVVLLRPSAIHGSAQAPGASALRLPLRATHGPLKGRLSTPSLRHPWLRPSGGRGRTSTLHPPSPPSARLPRAIHGPRFTAKANMGAGSQRLKANFPALTPRSGSWPCTRSPGTGAALYGPEIRSQARSRPGRARFAPPSGKSELVREPRSRERTRGHTSASPPAAAPASLRNPPRLPASHRTL